MDIAETNFKQKCPKHPDFKVEFLSVENLETNQEDRNLFYCSVCVSESTSKQQNYLLIKQIIKCSTDQILSKWPPISDFQLINQLTKLTTGDEDIESIVAQIEAYFTDLKDDILKQIDTCWKKMIEQANDLPQKKSQISKKYQELSKVQELRSVLMDNKTDIHEKERQCKIVVEKLIAEKKSINEQLTTLLNQYQQQNLIFNFKPAIEMKESILQTISDINFFQKSTVFIENKNNKQQHLDVQLVKTDFNKGYEHTEITKIQNNQYQAIIKQIGWKNIVSNILLEKNKKYIFRIEIQLQQTDNCMIGLMKDTDINNDYGYSKKMSCFLNNNQNQQISKHPQKHGIDNLTKGDAFQLSENNVIEMRVCLEDEILEVVDYPDYHCKLALQDQYKDNMKNEKLRLYLGIYNLNNKMILKEAFTVQQFE